MQTREQYKKIKQLLHDKKYRWLYLILGIIIMIIVCLGLFITLEPNATNQGSNQPPKSPNLLTHKEIKRLPKINNKLQGYYQYSLSSDDINIFLHLTHHHFYLQSGTDLTPRTKKITEKHMQDQSFHHHLSPKDLNQQWNDYVKDNQKNQKHLSVIIYKIQQTHHDIILRGVTGNHHQYHIAFKKKQHQIVVNSQYTQNLTQNLVSKLTFNKITSYQAKNLIKQDKLSLKQLNS